MKAAFKKTWIVFKYLFLLFALIYWVVVIIDDWAFIEQYWATNWLEYLRIWALYFLAYSLAFSFYFWSISAVSILVYHKIIKRRKDK